MDKEKLIKSYKTRDRVVRVMDKSGHFRISALKNTNAARTAQQRHGLPALPAFLLARQLSAGSLMAAFLKGEERIILEATGSGPVKRVFAEAIQVGEIRGYVEYNPKITDMELKDISQALGDGIFRVSRILYNKTEPLTGIVKLIRGDIASDLAQYFVQSEQIPSAVILDAELDDKGLIKNSGGIIVQAMPDASEKELNEVYEHLSGAQELNRFLQSDMTPVDILKDILPFEIELARSSPVDFYCRCSKEAFMEKLIALGKDELDEMQKLGRNELKCIYCNESYTLDKNDFNELKTEIEAKKN